MSALSTTKRVAIIVAKTIAWVVGGVLLLVVAVGLALQVSSVQTYVAHQGASWLQKKIGTEVKIAKVDIDFVKTIVLEGVLARDKSGDTLLYAGHLGVDIGLFAFAKKEVNVNQVTLYDAVAKLRKPADKDVFNFQYIVDAFADTTAPKQPADTSKGWTIDAERLRVRNVRFLLDDRFGDMRIATAIGNLSADFKTLGLDDKHIQLKTFTLTGTVARLQMAAPDTAKIIDSAAAKAQALAATAKDEPLNPSGWSFSVADAQLRQVGFYNDVKGTPIKPGTFDYKHMALAPLSIHLQKVEVGANDITGTLAIALQEANARINLQSLQADVAIHAPAYGITLRELRTPNSSLRHPIEAGIRNLKDTNLLTSLYARASFNGDSLSAKDGLPFAPILDSLGLGKLCIKLGGKLDLAGAKINTDKLLLAANPSNYIRLTGKVEDYADVARLRLTHLVHEVALEPRFAAAFLPKNALPPEAYKLGHLQLHGETDGTIGGLTGSESIASAFGPILIERYHYKTTPAFATHSGSADIRLGGVNPSVIIGKSAGVGPIYLTAQLAGGYSKRGGPALTKGEVAIQRAVYNKYPYRNIHLSATYLASVAKAHIVSQDSNLKTNLRIGADMRPRQPIFTANGRTIAYLDRLGFAADTLSVATTINGRVQGTDPDRLTANVLLTNNAIHQAGRKAAFDSLSIFAGADSGQRLISIASPMLQMHMLGRFQLARLGDALTTHIAQYVPISGLKQVRNLPPQVFTLRAHIPANPHPLELLAPGLRVPQPINLKIDFNSGKGKFDTDLDVANLAYGTNQASGVAFSTRSKAKTWDIDLKAQTLAADSFIIPEPRVNFNIREGSADFKLAVASETADSRARIGGKLLSVGAITRVSLSETDLYLKKQKWDLDNNALIEVGGNHLVVRNFSIDNEEDSTKSILIKTPDGVAKNALEANIQNIAITDITRLLPPLGYNVEGRINLRGSVENVFTMKGLAADLALDSLNVNGTPAGRFTAKASQPDPARIALDALLKHGGNGVSLAGVYNLQDTTHALDFKLVMDNFHPDEIAPLLHDFVTDWKGTLEARLTIKGSVANPDLEGYLAFVGKNILQPAFTQVPYTLQDQRLDFANRQLTLNNFTLGDDEGKQLTVDGTVHLLDVTDPTLHLSINADHFHMLQTRAKDNESFYGTAYISTKMQANGPAAGLAVDGQVTTEEGTRMTYNLAAGTPGQSSTAAYILFKDSRDSTKHKKVVKAATSEKIAVEGLGLNMRIRLTKDTRFMVIIDPKTGDRLECQGVADLKLSLQPNGEVNLQGNYALSDGFYNLNLLGVVSRQFKIRDGSTLQWTGDPANAKADLTAAYTTKAARYELVADEEDAMSPAEIAAAKRREPVSVLLKITGTLMQPSIKFDLEVPDQEASGGSSLVAARIAQITANENEVNKQALGIIAFNRFVNTGETTGGGGQSTTEQVNDKVDATVSDVLSRQLSNLSQEYLGGVELNVNVGSNEDPSGGSNTSFTDKNVGVSVAKSFANDRLKVSVGGQVNSQSNSGASGSGSSGTPVLGDVTAEYRLDKKGELSLKFFRTYNQGFYTTSSTERIGGSLAQNKNFSSISRLFWSKEKKAKDRERLKNQREGKMPKAQAVK